MTEARFTSSAKALSDALSAYRQQRSTYFKSLAAAMRRLSSSLAPAVRGISHAKQLEIVAGSGAEPQVSTFIHTS